MKISLNTIKQFTDIELSLDELTAKINSQLGAIEDTIDLNDVYKDAVIVKVVACEKHPNADKLSVCRVDDGGSLESVERDEDRLVQVVCGAPNVRAGMFAVWLPPRSTVPSTYHDETPFVLGARELRGIMSQGMLAAGDELGINSDHDGIVELTKSDLKNDPDQLEPGASFAKTFGLDDYIIDIENKMFTHRPDLFGQIGVAREIFAITQPDPASDENTDIRFNEPSWYWSRQAFSDAAGLELEVFNEAKENVPRFMTVAMKGVRVAPSPLWLQTELVRWGARPINNIVDITNYIMLLTAQPVHAYDYDKIRGHRIGARMARDGETVKLLNGKTYQLDTADIVIADGEGPIGLAGIMGGGESEVDANTKNLILEVANFDMYTLRRSSMRHGVFTDALTRFNKGQSCLQNDQVLRHLISLLAEYGGAVQASNVYDENNFTAETDRSTLSGELIIRPSFINQRLGLSLTRQAIGNILRRVNFVAFQPGDDPDELSVTAPFWRTDIEQPEDIVEEVGRLYGFDRIPRELPLRSSRPTPKNKTRELKQLIRTCLAKYGANEVLTYSFVHEKVIKTAGQNTEHAFKLSNALSPDLQFYRISLTPSLLSKVHMNQKAGHDSFALFELGKTHFVGETDADEPSVPNEDSHIAFIVTYSDKKKTTSPPYYNAKQYLKKITDLSALDFVSLRDFDINSDPWGRQLAAPYEPSRSAVILKDKQIYGVVGEFKQQVRRAFKLPSFTAGFEIHLDAVVTPMDLYQSLSRFPSVTQDVTVNVSLETKFEIVQAKVSATLDALNSDWRSVSEVLSIYQPEGGSEKSISFRITLSNLTRSLKTSEAEEIIESIRASVG